MQRRCKDALEGEGDKQTKTNIQRVKLSSQSGVPKLYQNYSKVWLKFEERSEVQAASWRVKYLSCLPLPLSVVSCQLWQQHMQKNRDVRIPFKKHSINFTLQQQRVLARLTILISKFYSAWNTALLPLNSHHFHWALFPHRPNLWTFSFIHAKNCCSLVIHDLCSVWWQLLWTGTQCAMKQKTTGCCRIYLKIFLQTLKISR